MTRSFHIECCFFGDLEISEEFISGDCYYKKLTIGGQAINTKTLAFAYFPSHSICITDTRALKRLPLKGI